MSNINELKDAVNTKTLNLVLLSIATGGIYPLMWLFKNQDRLNNILGREFSNNIFIIWIAVCAGLSSFLTGTGEETLDVIGGLLIIASSILYIVWAFKAKNSLQEYVLTEHKIDLKMNSFYTFAMNIYYINYCINDLPEAQRKQQVLNSNTEKAG